MGETTQVAAAPTSQLPLYMMKGPRESICGSIGKGGKYKWKNSQLLPHVLLLKHQTPEEGGES